MGRIASVFAASVTTDITPERQVPLGAGPTEKTDWQVHSLLEANMLALWVGEGPPLVLVSIDALYPGRVVRNAIEEALPGVPPENIMVGASHTHAAPMLDDTKAPLGQPDPEHMELVIRRLTDAAGSLLDPANRVAACLAAGRATADHSVNRRQVKRVTWVWPPKFNQFRWRPDFWGTRDEIVTVLRVETRAGDPVAIVWNYACHPVCFPLSGAVSSHYPGVVRDAIRSHDDASVPILFFQGFSGDIRPLDMAEPRIPPSVRHLYRRVRFGTDWRIDLWNMEKYSQWASSLANVVLRALGRAQPINYTKGEEISVQVARVEAPRTDFVSPDGAPVTFQVARLGQALGMLAVGAEVVAPYAKFARKALGTKYSMLIGCVDDTVGYFPTSAMLKYGGYEAEDYLPNFSLERLNPRVQENVELYLNQVTGEEVEEPTKPIERTKP